MTDDADLADMPATAEPPSPAAQVRGLIDEVKALADAEISYAKARLSYSSGIVRKAGQWALFAMLFLAGAVMALIVGMLLIVAHFWGPVIATITVVLLFAVASAVSGLQARKIARRLSFDEDATDAR